MPRKSPINEAATKPPRKVMPAADAQVRILNAADDLFYREGARSVGIDAVIKQAGVNKMSLYRQFESKDALLLEYLAHRDERFWNMINASIAKHPDEPKQQLVQIFVDMANKVSKPDYRGCPFVNIAIEFPDREHAARQVVASNKAELLTRLHELSTKAGATNPEFLANSLAILFEGICTASQTYAAQPDVFASLPVLAEQIVVSACAR